MEQKLRYKIHRETITNYAITSNFHEICRICLNSNSLKSWKDHVYLLELFHKITDIEVDDCNDLQKYVCNKCIEILEDISEFIDISRYNNRNFKETFAADPIKEPTTIGNLKISSGDDMRDTNGFGENNDSIYSVLSNNDYIQRENIAQENNSSKNSGSINDYHYRKISMQSVQQDETSDQDIIELKSMFHFEQEENCQKRNYTNPSSSNTDENCDGNDTQSGCYPILNSTGTGEIKTAEQPTPTTNHTKRKSAESQRKHFTSNKKNKPNLSMRYECPFCKKTFTQKGNMQTHTRLHTGEKPFQCSCCSEKFHQLSNLNRHMLSHISNFSCSICFKQYISQQDLEKHRTTHKADKQYLCYICAKKFSYKWSLEAHLQVHYDKKQSQELVGRDVYRCQVCLQEFTLKSDFKRHAQTHSKAEHARRCERNLNLKSLKNS